MTACVDTESTVYHCVVCGPCLRMDCENGEVTMHNNVPHPNTMTFDEEERPQ